MCRSPSAKSPVAGRLQGSFPITSYDEKITLDFASYEIGEPKLSIARRCARGRLQRAAARYFPAQGRARPKEEKVYMGESRS